MFAFSLIAKIRFLQHARKAYFVCRLSALVAFPSSSAMPKRGASKASSPANAKRAMAKASHTPPPTVASRPQIAHSSSPTDESFAGFRCVFDEPSFMLAAVTALSKKQASRQSTTSVEWWSLAHTSNSFELKWKKHVKYRAGYMWVQRALCSIEGIEGKYRVEGIRE